jgi:nifR3 family TIM-barrel protein
MNLGKIKIANNLLLAPLQNITTPPFRRFCRKFFNIGLVFIPMIYTKRITSDIKSIKEELIKIEQEKPIFLQLMGRDLDDFKKTLELLESYDLSGVDINAGCSSKRSLNSKSGAYLIKDLDHLVKLLDTVVKYTSYPISLKTRIGDSKPENIKEIIRIVNNSDIDFLTIHARTIKGKFDKNELNLEALKTFKELSKIPVIGNGDITDPYSAKEVLELTKVDGLMIGREAMGNPNIFNEISDFLSKGEFTPFTNDLEVWYERVCLYEKCIEDYLNDIEISISYEDYKFSELKRNSIWLTRNLRNSTSLRKKLSKTKSLEQLKSQIEKIYNSNT